jgi:hypothetical protein
MGRNIKNGLDYFPVDVKIDDNLELLEAEHGLQGFAIVIKLWQKIYSAGYYIDWNQDCALLFSRKINSDVNLINSVINTCFKRGLLDEKKYKKYAILTSSGIQKRFFLICKQLKRTQVNVTNEYLLINPEDNSIIPEENHINPVESTQKKGKEKKGKEKEDWRTDFEFYKSELRKEYIAIKADEVWLEKQRDKLPDYVDLIKSIAHICETYWATDEGWAQKKKSRSVDLNWRATISRGLQDKRNQIWYKK